MSDTYSPWSAKPLPLPSNERPACASITFSRACVPGSLSPDRELVAVRTCARLRWRAHSGLIPGLNRTRTPPVTQSVAGPVLRGAASNWIAAVVAFGSALARSLSRPARSGPLPTRMDMWSGCLRFLGALGKALRFLSFRSLVHDANQPTRGFFHRFSLSPVLSSSVLHDRNMQQKDVIGHGKSFHKHG